uniref:HAUS augmin-like complex, subunit 7 n=1 Tax=Pygocentrus nattereri TaxID=42514 RepID=A0A3B4CCI1_PYGNA
MAGDSKQLQLSVRVYNTLQNLGCPLVDGLYLREADSMRELLCTPSLHRMDILKWICVRCVANSHYSIRTKGSLLYCHNHSVFTEIARFGHEMMLCKADERELIEV